jgi:THAP4-like, heme-binding beta-barrel domain
VRGTVGRMSAALHDDVVALAFLLGTWVGEGSGGYPTIEPFTYREELAFDDVGDAFLLYRQESWGDGDEPIHFERGFLRPGEGPGALELCLAHPIGVTEIAHGALHGTTINLTATHDDVGRTRTGLDVQGLRRRYEVADDTMRYTLDMATGDTPMTIHLEGVLRRTT